MALTQDQIFMLAQLADWAGSKMSPDNPFAGYASQYVQATNFAKLLQQAGQQPKPEEKPEEEPPKEETSAMAPANPFSPEYQPLRLPPKKQLNLSLGSEEAIKDIRDQIFLPGVDAKVDADNNVTLSRKIPATTNAAAAPTNMATASVYNPFLWRG